MKLKTLALTALMALPMTAAASSSAYEWCDEVSHLAGQAYVNYQAGTSAVENIGLIRNSCGDLMSDCRGFAIAAVQDAHRYSRGYSYMDVDYVAGKAVEIKEDVQIQCISDAHEAGLL